MTKEQDPFQAIRPYKDQEVTKVLQRLLYDDELITAITDYKFSRAKKIFSWFLKPMVRIALAREIDNVDSIRALQKLVADYMAKMVARTTTKLIVSGIDKLDSEQAYLFVSNHRDIAMDPAFINWSLYQFGLETVRIAIGDNLLKKPYVSDLMRLNKSFIVNRSATGPREMMKALTQLSEYIDNSLVCDEQSIWIAQREGRAKDGNDFTDPAILKMLAMAQRKMKRSFSEGMQRLNIVPVAISYQYDPCDTLKTNELHDLNQQGVYEKTEFEDIDSIVEGIVGYKGHVHVAFGEVITGEFETPEALAAAIDEQIHRNYHLHSTNLIAADRIDEVSEADLAEFQARLDKVPAAAQGILKSMYANPVFNQEKANSSFKEQA